MLAVEIPAALATDPQVVPVDPSPSSAWPLTALVGQRVALAWRETCPTCGGKGEVDIDNGRGGFIMPCGSCGVPDDQVTEENCWQNGTGSRMVVGWTAEVEAVVPIVGFHECADTPAHVCVLRGVSLLLHWPLNTTRNDEDTEVALDRLLALADWSPGRYALVLSEVTTPGPGLTPFACLPFSGFAELSDVLT